MSTNRAKGHNENNGEEVSPVETVEDRLGTNDPRHARRDWVDWARLVIEVLTLIVVVVG